MHSILLAIALLAAAETHPVRLEGVAQAGSKPARDAVVWIETGGGVRPPRGKRPVLEQRDLSFKPRVLVIEAGTEVEFPNRDRVFHNVFSFRDGKQFDLGLYPAGASRTILFDKPGVSRLFCNIHPNMAGYILVVDSPHFALAGADGRFVIADVPAGTFAYHAWRPGGEVLNGTANVAAGVPLEVRWP